MAKVKKCFVVHVKSTEIELVHAFLDRIHALKFAESWGKHSSLYELDIRD